MAAIPRKRNRPHTRTEWQARRREIEKLYQAEDRKLDEVIEILAKRGFHAM